MRQPVPEPRWIADRVGLGDLRYALAYQAPPRTSPRAFAALEAL
jgi:hypothetical protein